MTLTLVFIFSSIAPYHACMADPYTTVIGLEVHVQLLTRTKLFCGCSTAFGLPPNSATCPVCLGMPGALPVMNRKAFDLALKAALALQAQVAPFTKWDRKNYFYPDLPKNYQISQYDLPFSTGGGLEIAGRSIRLIRVHLEEDAGKLIHGDDASKIDLNRAGTPLLEIVTEPDMRSSDEAVAFLQELRLLARELKISDCEMQEGSLRCDANVNIHIPRACSFVPTPIVEVKNMNSIRAVERALKYETARQYQQFLQDGKRQGDAPKATAGWDEQAGVTRMQRRKEEVSDYRYFPEPDLPPVVVDAAWLERIRITLGELPAAQRRRLRDEYGLSEYDADVLTRQGRAFVAYFEETARLSGDAKTAANWANNEVLASLTTSIRDFPITASKLAGLIREVQKSGLNKQRSREVYSHMLEHGSDAADAIAALGFQSISDESQLREIVQRAIAANPQAVADFRKGKTKAADRIKGFVMKETKGMANTEVVQRLVGEILAQ